MDEVKSIRDKAKSMQAYAQQALNRDSEITCAKIRIRAERKAGQMLNEQAKNGQRANKGRPKMSSDTTLLSDIGVSRDQSSDWQKLASVSDEEFEQALERAEKVPTTKGDIEANLTTDWRD